jgi:putative transposase
LREAEKGAQTIGAVCRAHSISENTFYKWRQKYGGMEVADARRLRELEKENARLKRLLAESVIEIDAMKEVIAKKW